jgi:hypothetical protein
MAVDPTLAARVSSYFGRSRAGGASSFSYLPLQSATPVASNANNSSEAPQNVGQWLLNLLSTGTYMTANIGQQYGDAVEKVKAGDNFGGYLQGVIAPVSGALMGLTEGFGGRFDRNGDGVQERPRTWGQNLEDLGAFDWVNPEDSGQVFGQAAISTVADIALDPTTYLSVGAIPIIKGLFKGGAAALKGAEEAGVIGGALKGASTEWNAARTATQLAKANRAENRGLRRDFADQIRAGLIDKADIPQIRQVLATAGVSRAAMSPEVMAAVQDGLRAAKEAPVVAGDEIIEAGSASKLPSSLPERRYADELVPTLRGQRANPPDPAAVRSMFEKSLNRPKAAKGALPTPKFSSTADTLVRRIADDLVDPAEIKTALAAIGRLKNGAELLKHPVTVGARQMPLRQLLQEMHARRASGAPPRPEHRAALDSALRPGATPPTPAVFNPARLSELMREQYGRELTQEDLARFLSTPNTDKLDVLRQIAGGPQAVGYSDFAEALAGASAGELSATAMRRMAEAVGIRVPTRATTDEVRSLLKTEGQFNWDRITGALRSEGEVMADHGLDALETATARGIDVGAAKTQLGADFAAKVAPSSGSRRGMGAYAAITALGEEWAKRLDKGVESFDLLSNQTMRTIIAAASKAMQPTATHLIGADRAGFGADLAEVIRLVESWADAAGSMPHIYGTSFADTWQVRFSDILDNLGPEVTGKALFTPMVYRQVASKTGLTIYPTTIAKATAEALKHADAGFTPEQVAYQVTSTILEDSKRVRNEFIGTADGQAAVAALSARMSDPEFTTALLAVHAARKPLAAAMSIDTAARAVTPVGDAIVKALAKAAGGGDRAEVFSIIDEGWNMAARLRGGKPLGHLVDDVARERLNQGFLRGVLGEAGARVFKADTRSARANNPGNAVRSPREAAQGAEEAQAALQARGPRTGPEGQPQKARRNQQSKAEVKNLDDAADIHTQAIDDMIAKGEIEDTPLGRIEALFELEMAYKGGRMFHKLGQALEGSFGQADLKGLATAVNGNTYRLSGLYAESMVKWAKKIGYDKDPGQLGKLWRALARAPIGAGDDVLRGVLTAGQRADALNPLARTAIDPLTAEEADLALELKQFIDVVFAPGGHGMFSRSGVVASDLAKELRRVGARDGGEAWAKFKVDDQLALPDQTGLWRTWDLVDGDDPLDVLVKYHTALQASSVKPSVGASLARHFGNEAAGMSAAEAAAAGWKKVDTFAEDADLARFVDPDAYFPSEIVKQMAYTQEFLNASTRFEGQLGRFMDVYDSVLSVLKSSNTLWRPGHHVTNVLGETFMNFMAGVNPMRYTKGVAAMRAGGHLTDADLSPLARYNASNTPAGFQVKESFGSDATQVVLNVGGKKQLMSIDPGSIWQAALDHSVAITHGLAEDILAPTMAKLNPSAGRQLLSPVIETNTALARFSAARDNVFRLTHFVDALEKGQYRTLDEAFRQAAKVVHDYHPTMQTLSAFEQKYARRLVFFYTWQRQAIARVLKTALDKPGLVTAPSKIQYNLAEANGLQPDSFGAPQNGDPRIASYGSETLLGPTFEAGLTPFDEGSNLWGFSMSAPQIDGIQSLFKGLTVKPEDGAGNIGNMLAGIGEGAAGQLPPLLKAPIELATGNKVGDGGPIDDIGEYLLAQTGLPNQLNNAMGGSADPRKSAEENQADQLRSALNLLTGMKFQNYTTPQSANRAHQEEVERQRKLAGLE